MLGSSARAFISVIPQPDTAVPEPGTFQFLAAAAGLVALTRWRILRA
ncbi:MAG: PEP-CTERM sorting domain-containing protein [Bryobacterales bacterium]|nr:PEP-CTERM sorting domain-containing protein [Bryobacterales bacterium]